MVSENFDDKNLKKHLKTKGGMDLLILEENGKQSVTLTTPKGNVLTVSDETESCKISDKDGKNQISMDYKNGKVTVQAEKTIEGRKCGAYHGWKWRSYQSESKEDWSDSG